MKIETYLSPNCSESTFTVVNWKKKKIIDTWEETSESADADSIASFIENIWGFLQDKDLSIEVKSNGDGFHPELLDVLTELKAEGVKMVDRDSPQMEKMSEELLNHDGNNYKGVILQNLKSKVELLAEGFYGGKKRGTKSR